MACRHESVPVFYDGGDDALLEALHRDTSVKLRRTDTNTDLMIHFMPIGELLEPQLMPVMVVEGGWASASGAGFTTSPATQARYLARQARLVRTWGDCYGYLLLSGGWADVMLDPIMNPWDIAALVPVVRGAGGIITDWQGGPAYPASSTIATCPELHAQVVAALNEG